MGYKYSGIKKVEYQAAGGNWSAAVDLGTPTADSPGFTPAPQEVEIGNGNMLYAGNKKECVFNITDLTKFDALDTIMKADTEIDVRITFVDGTTTEIILASCLAKVKYNYGSAVGGRNTFEFKAAGFAV